jgi:hypothetical protein
VPRVPPRFDHETARDVPHFPDRACIASAAVAWSFGGADHDAGSVQDTDPEGPEQCQVGSVGAAPVAQAPGGRPRDDTAVLCLDRYGARPATATANTRHLGPAPPAGV